jgi:hypothetical protein
MFITISLLLAAACLLPAVGKLTGNPKMRQSAAHFGIPGPATSAGDHLDLRGCHVAPVAQDLLRHACGGPGPLDHGAPAGRLAAAVAEDSRSQAFPRALSLAAQVVAGKPRQRPAIRLTVGG